MMMSAKLGPSASANHDSLLVELVEELTNKVQAGEAVDLEAYAARYPGQARKLRELLPALQVLADLSGATPSADVTGPYPGPALAERPPRIPGYEVDGVLGRGGMGIVYKSRQVAADRVVALKVLLHGPHASQDTLERFRVEAKAIARLQHPHIVQVYEVGEHDGLPFFSLEYCPGGSLDKKLAGTPLMAREAATLVQELALAIHAAHQKGIIHRDLTPANVLLAEDGTPKVTDFGLAKMVDETGRTVTGAVMGTPPYMAPEQAAGRVQSIGPATDVYALGAILYELLTGRPPFRAAVPMDTLQQVLSDEPVPPSRLQRKIPADLETICLKCLEKSPGQRYKSADALAGDLRRFLDGLPIQARRPGMAAQIRSWLRRPERMRDAGLIQIWIATTYSIVVIAQCFRIGSGYPKGFLVSVHTPSVLLYICLWSVIGVLGTWFGLKTIAQKQWAIWAGLVWSLSQLLSKLFVGLDSKFSPTGRQEVTYNISIRDFNRISQFPVTSLSVELLPAFLTCVALYAFHVNHGITWFQPIKKRLLDSPALRVTPCRRLMEWLCRYTMLGAIAGLVIVLLGWWPRYTNDLYNRFAGFTIEFLAGVALFGALIGAACGVIGWAASKRWRT
jgi:hypothetical protein